MIRARRFVAATVLGLVWCSSADVARARGQAAIPLASPAVPPTPFGAELSVTGGRSRAGIDEGAAALQSPGLDGRHVHVQGGWRYTRPARSRFLTVSGHSAFRYFPDAGTALIDSHGIEVAGSWRAGRGVTVDGSQRASYAPLSLFGAFENVPAIASGALALDEGLFTRMTFRHSGSLSMTRVLGRRTSLAIGYDYAAGRAHDGGATRSQLVSAGIRRTISPGTALRLGYGVGSAGFRGGSLMAMRHNIDAGVDWSRPMPFSRRSTVTLRTGSVVLAGDRTTSRLDVSADASHVIGRDWRVHLSYDRPMQFIEGFQEPLLSDAVTASLEGRLPLRTAVAAAFSLSDGSVGVALRQHGFQAHGGSVRADVPVDARRRVLVSVEYTDFEYRFAETLALPARLPRALRRRAVSAGFRWTLGSVTRGY